MKTLLYFVLLLFCTTVSAQNFLRSFGSINNDEALAIGMDDEGRVYTSGYFNGNLAFGGNNVISNGLSDLFVARNSSVGGTQWIFSGGSSGPDRGFDIATAPDGTSIITGFYSNNAQFGNYTLPTNNFSQDFFVIKLDNLGEVVWAKGFGGEHGDTGYAVDIDINGNIVVTGQFRGTIDFDGTIFTSTVINGGELSYDTFVLKMDSDGNVLWAKQGQNAYESRGLDVKTDGLGNVIVCGQFSDTLTFDETHYNDIFNAAFVIQFDANGNEQWFRRFTSSQTIAYALEINSDNEIYVTGDNIGGMLFYTDGGSTYFPNDYTYNLFLAKFTQNGELLWLTNNGSENPISSKDIALDADELPYITGTFNCRFDEYSEEYGTGIFYSAGWRDVFISKFNTAGDRQWSRHMASNRDDYCSAIILKDVDMPIIAGSFENKFVVTNANTFTDYNSNETAYINGPLCGDDNYGEMRYEISNGNKDIFLTAPINLSREPLDYFSRSSVCERPYLPVCVNFCEDSLIHCGPTSAPFSTYTSNLLTPEYDLAWESEDYQNIPSLYIPGTSNYYWTYERQDGCYSKSDTLHATINPVPLSLISDDVIVNTESPPDASPIFLCYPDSALLMGSNFDQTDQISWSGSTSFLETESDSAILVYESGIYSFTITNIFGCFSENDIGVEVYIPIDSIGATIALPEYSEPVDTIYICEGEDFLVELINSDSLGQDIAEILENATIEWTISPNGSIYSSSEGLEFAEAIVYDTALYTISATITSTCGDVEVSFERVVYVVVYPEPDINIWISGDNYICPGDSTLLVANGYENYNWSNDDYIQISNDSILVWEEGSYSINATVQNEFGCSDGSYDNFYLNYRNAPLVEMLPASGLVCPGDSVFLTTESAIAHIWVGPMGQIIGTDQSIWVDIPGFYHCIVTDFDSCMIESNFVEVKEYASPYLIMDPGNDLCITGSIEIQAITDPSASVYWEPPLNSTNHTVTVSEPGVYTASVTLCGITTTQSVTVYETSVNASITLNDPPTVCNGDSILLIGNSGMYEYEWNPGGENSTNLWVTEPGIYTLYTYDEQGCEGVSQPVEITGGPSLEWNIPPSVYICPEDSISLSVDGNFLEFNWIPTGDSLPEIWVTEPGSYQVEVVDENGCMGISEILEIIPGENPVLPEVEDIIHCSGDDLIVNIEGNDDVLWLTDDGPEASNPLIIESLDTDTVLHFFVMAENGCTSAEDSILVQVVPSTYIPEIMGDIEVCTNDTLFLFTDDLIETEYNWSLNGTSWSNSSELQFPTDSLLNSPLTIVLDVEVADCAVGQNSIEITILPLPDPLPILGNGFPCDTSSTWLYTEHPDSLSLIWQWLDIQASSDSVQIDPAGYDSVLVSLTTVLNGCAAQPEELWVNQQPIPELLEMITNAPVCSGELLNITGSTNDFADISITTPLGYTVSNQLNLFPADTSDSGLYVITAESPYCSISDTLNVQVNPLPDIDLGPDTTYCTGSVAQFEIQEYELVFWNDSILGNTFSTTNNGIVRAEVFNEFGCSAKDSVLIRFDSCDGILNNVFSPNGDGVNDTFNFNPYGFEELHVVIYNRWGKVVCEMVDIDHWDGIHCKTGIPVSYGTYFYIVSYATREYVNGTKKGYIQVFK